MIHNLYLTRFLFVRENFDLDIYVIYVGFLIMCDNSYF